MPPPAIALIAHSQRLLAAPEDGSDTLGDTAISLPNHLE